MKVRVGDQEWPIDVNAVSLRDAWEVQEATGYTLTTFNDGFQKGEAKALLALVFFARRQAGEKIAFSDIDFSLGDFEAIDDEPDPTTADVTGDPTTSASTGLEGTTTSLRSA